MEPDLKDKFLSTVESSKASNHPLAEIIREILNLATLYVDHRARPERSTIRQGASCVPNLDEGSKLRPHHMAVLMRYVRRVLKQETWDLERLIDGFIEQEDIFVQHDLWRPQKVPSLEKLRALSPSRVKTLRERPVGSSGHRRGVTFRVP